VQCKFSVDPSGTLAPSDLDEELAKIEALHARGLRDGYMVLTNLRVTGRTRAWFAEEVRRRGPEVIAILPATWICAQIEKNWNLRRYVPRVYGLGDLTGILDERRMRQARALLTSLTRELETFVPTGAYRGASDAITDHGSATSVLMAAAAPPAAVISSTILGAFGVAGVVHDHACPPGLAVARRPRGRCRSTLRWRRLLGWWFSLTPILPLGVSRGVRSLRGDGM
jgi:hypothetical protein